MTTTKEPLMKEIKETEYDSIPHNQVFKISNDLIFIPCYPALIVKSLKDMQISQGQVTLLGTIILRFFTKGLPDEVLNHIIEKGVGLRINDQTYSITKDTANIKRDYFLSFTERVKLDLSFNILLKATPFDTFQIPIVFELTSRTLDDGLTYRFVIHLDESDSLTNMSFRKADNMPEFNLAHDLMKVEFGEVDEKVEKGEVQYSYVSKATFLIGLYRQPLPIILSVMFPLFLINCIIVGIDWVKGDAAQLLTNVTTILLVLVAYLPSVRQSIPNQPTITLLDSILISLILQCLWVLSSIFFLGVDEESQRFHHVMVTSALFAVWVVTILFFILVYTIKKGKHDKFPYQTKRDLRNYSGTSKVTIAWASPQIHSNSLKVLTLNILAQHLVDGECPAYRQRHDPSNPSDLRTLRFNNFINFLSSTALKGFDILNLQEIGSFDLELLAQIIKTLNKSSTTFQLVIASLPTGKQQLKCATIYDCQKFQLFDIQGLFQVQDDQCTQFGLITHFQSQHLGKLTICNVHMSGGATQNDKDKRAAQIKILEKQSFWKESTPIILAGDFNTEISAEFIQQIKSIHEEILYIYDKQDSYFTENRIQKRNRDGQVGISVVQRTVDAIFYRGLTLYQPSSKPQNFDDIVKKEYLDSLQKELSNPSALKDSQLLDKIKKSEAGFPSSQWFSDHLPLGAIFRI